MRTFPRPTYPRRIAAAAALTALLAALPALGDNVADLGRRLAALRGEVERLSGTLSSKQAELRDELRSAARQKADLEAELKKEQTRLQKVQLNIGQKKKLIESENSEDEKLRPVFEQELSAARAYVKGTLPFRSGERLAELDKIENQYKAGLATPQRALSRLWSFLEDEFRLTRENGLYRQTIVLDGKEQLADVVRIGMVMLYFRTSDDEVGIAERSGDGYRFRRVEQEEDRRLVVNLFDSFKKQIRVGYFNLPSALPAGDQQ
jgi:uncharacterized small protein (DUF1192 family)